MQLSSRRILSSKQAGVTVTCGWDNPPETYFCTVLRQLPLSEEDADPVVLWLGLDRGEVRTLEDMAAPIEPDADFDARTIRLLRADRGEDSTTLFKITSS